MTSPTQQPPPGPAADAISAALANRDMIMRSLEERRQQVFKLLETQKQEALDSLARAREMLKAPAPAAGAPAGAWGAQTAPSATLPAAQSRESVRGRLAETLTVLCALQGAGGSAAQGLREQAVSGLVEALSELVAAEVARCLQR